MLQAVIFDMDGLLVDSEPLWRRAEQAIFPKVSIELTDEMCMQTMGLRVDEVVRYWFERRPWNGHSQEEIAAEVLDAVVELVEKEARPMEGVGYILDFFKERDFKIALASSSAYRLIDAVIDKFSIRSYFDVLQSAEDQPYGKPHPGVFITTAVRLGVNPTACLVFEDSFAGLIASRAARMKVVVVPEGEAFYQSRFEIADLKLRSLRQFDEEALKQVQADGG